MCSGSLRPFHGSYTSILLLSRLAQRPLVGVRHSNAAAIRISVSEMEREVLQQKNESLYFAVPTKNTARY